MTIWSIIGWLYTIVGMVLMIVAMAMGESGEGPRMMMMFGQVIVCICAAAEYIKTKD
jgi:VIT1/CCC1 family predicted Fe2+/Mn2+ transporter